MNPAQEAHMTSTNRYTIVVGFDLSEPSEVALDQAIELAQAHEDCRLHVLAVLDERNGLPGLAEVGDFAAAERTQTALATLVDKRLLEARSRPVNLFLHARIGSPAVEILELAEEAEADLIVVGTHGRRGVSRLVLGSVAERVVRHARLPVLVSRPGIMREEEEERASRWDPEPPCIHCVDTRRDTNGEIWWCQLHSKPHPLPHRYQYRHSFSQQRAWTEPQG
jgi:nucleotide-binding universal stress UspA family protein